MRQRGKQLMARVGVGAVFAMVASMASATALVDYSTAVTTATTEIGAAITGGLPIFGTIFGIGVGMAIFRKFKRG